MAKCMILFLFIFTISYAQSLNDDVVNNYYYQILLKKWETSADCQKLELTDSMAHQMIDVEALEMVKKALYNYNKEWDLDNVRIGKDGEYILARARKAPKLFGSDQYWFLISTVFKKIVSTHKDKIKPDIPVEMSPKKEREQEAHSIYKRLLEEWDYEWYPPQWSWWRYNTRNNFTITKDGIDSITAISIAVEGAKKRYGLEITALTARLMGNNEEHWLVYCFPTIPIDGDCYYALIWNYDKGRLFVSGTRRDMEMGCPCPIGILISKEDGQVLYMGDCISWLGLPISSTIHPYHPDPRWRLPRREPVPKELLKKMKK